MSIVKALSILALTTSLFMGCQKEEHFIYQEEESFSTEFIGSTQQDTLNWLQAELEGMYLPTEWENEQFSENVKTMETEDILVGDEYLNAEVIEGHFVVEGDIIVGTESGLRDNRAEHRGSVHSSENRRWPGGIIPYVIQPGHPITNRILDAIDSLNNRTNLTLKPRTNETDYIYYQISTGCASWVGRQGGLQVIRASSSCSVGNMIHETLHAAGMWHEQSRCDRNNFVSILWNNISSGREGNFGMHCKTMQNPGVNDDKDGKDVGSYNYESIMHYGSYAFSSNNRRTILPRGATKYQMLTRAAMIGQRSKISAGDIYTVARMYPVKAEVWYSIKFRHSQKVWNLTGGNSKIGTSIQQKSASSFTNYSQQFKFIPQSDGSYQIVNRRSGYALEIRKGSHANYAALQINKYWGGNHQKFEIEHASGNYFKILTKHSKKAIQTKPENLGSGPVLHQYSLRSSSNQQLEFIRK